MEPTTTSGVTEVLPPLPVVLSPEDIEDIRSEPIGEIEGVRDKVLWRDATSRAGLLRIDAGSHLGVHTHTRHHHHVWMILGHADVVGQRVGPDSYIHIPLGVAHDVDATATEGCTLLYLYLEA
jgi:hypothetical protein